MSYQIFPALKKGYNLHKGPKYGYVYPFSLGSNDTGHVINEDAARILDKCDGNTSLEDIARTLAFQYQEDFNSVLVTIKSYIEGSEAFIEILDKKMDVNFQSTGNWDIQTPTHASIELTYKCNFSCKHCYINSSPKNDEFWEKNKLFEILSDLKSLGILIVELTGGEPLVHPDFPEIIERCLQLFPVVGVDTNGYLLKKTHLKIINNYNNRVFFQVDMHGDNPKYVDWFCNHEGAFENAKKAIMMLSKENFIVRAAMTLTPMNIDQIFSTISLVKNLGATNMILSTVVPTGRGRSSELIFSPENMEHVINQVEKAKKKFGDFLFEDPEYLPIIGEINNNKLNCGAASRSICFTPNGEIKMCPMSNPNDFSLGNVYKESVHTILSKNISSLLIELEDPKQEICGDCEYLWYCHRCIARGLQKYHEIHELCVWGRSLKLLSILEEVNTFG
ncbi:radical SAM protein [Methanobacterium sp.]|uniref:radical SAM/SPASM domain-containing protein n=1 Tax=Methanobacterium sp. TaxID=2164 RepID=UPI0025FB6260|nr:radical SAM protein [Methanobacterium sp.]MBI5460160.1 radical SAM protein [Methanobacterium sp.]